MPKAPKEIGTDEAARIIGISQRAIQRAVRLGQIKARSVTSGKKLLWFIDAKDTAKYAMKRAKAAKK